jgi:TrmH family RNA methyltransferase
VVQHVTSRTNPRLKEAARLVASARDRRKSGRCVLEGEHLIAVYLARVGAPETLIVVADRLAQPPFAALAAAVPPGRVLAVAPSLFAELSTLPVDVGALAVIAVPDEPPPAAGQLHLLLEDLQDPGNVGAILRTAAAAGVEQVLLSRHCAFAWAPKVLRAAQGAHFCTTIVEDVDLPRWAEAFRAGGGRVVATVPRMGRDLYQCALRAPLALAIGNEGAGLSPALLAQTDLAVSIPMPGGTESLNAGAAAAVVLFEYVRQQRC